MKRFIILGFCVCVLAGFVLGCGEKQETLEQAEGPSLVEVTPITTNVTTPAAQKEVMPSPKGPVAISESEKAVEPSLPLPPPGPYKPTAEQIQTALKNAGYYTGDIDGKVGPKTLKAIKDFQAANNLEVDGKVGPKTWEVLSKYLNPPAEPTAKPKKAK